jgi:hypothetical protein
MAQEEHEDPKVIEQGYKIGVTWIAAKGIFDPSYWKKNGSLIWVKIEGVGRCKSGGNSQGVMKMWVCEIRIASSSSFSALFILIHSHTPLHSPFRALCRLAQCSFMPLTTVQCITDSCKWTLYADYEIRLDPDWKSWKILYSNLMSWMTLGPESKILWNFGTGRNSLFP